MRNAARLWFVLFPVLALAQVASEKPKIICDHAAPPRGMHYVCKSQCDCHLEGKLKDDEDGITPKSNLPDACQPLMTSIFAPLYPEIAVRNRIAGIVFVQVEIDPDGNVRDVSLQQGHPLLAKGVLKAARRWRFSPGCSKVQTLSVRFDLTDDEDRNPSGFRFNPPDDLSVIAPALIVETTETATDNKKRKKTAKPRIRVTSPAAHTSPRPPVVPSSK